MTQRGAFVFTLLLLCLYPCAQVEALEIAKGRAIDSIGYFSLSKVNGRHCIRSASGHPIFALGINHLSTSLSDHYRQLSAYSTDQKALKRLKRDLETWSMNNAGSDCPAFVKESMPFYLTLQITNNAHWLPTNRFSFTDVFDSTFIDATKQNIRQQVLAHRDNVNLIGYYWTDTPRWDVEISRRKHLKDWVSHFRNLPSGAAGKNRYVTFLRLEYGDIESLNEAYGLDFDSFDALHQARFDHIDINQSHIVEDDTQFLGVIAEHLYALAAQCIHSHDPNHLILGEKYIAGDHPLPVLKAAAKYVDVISIQPGPDFGPGPGPGRSEHTFDSTAFADIYRITGKPIMICDHTVSFHSSAYPVTLWHQLPTQEKAVEILSKYLNAVIATPYIIGYQHCQYLDVFDPRRGLLKQGIIGQDGKPHSTLSLGIAAINKSLHDQFAQQLISSTRASNTTALEH